MEGSKASAQRLGVDGRARRRLLWLALGAVIAGCGGEPGTTTQDPASAVELPNPFTELRPHAGDVLVPPQIGFRWALSGADGSEEDPAALRSGEFSADSGADDPASSDADGAEGEDPSGEGGGGDYDAGSSSHGAEPEDGSEVDSAEGRRLRSWSRSTPIRTGTLLPSCPGSRRSGSSGS
ncbi:MAG: hypothetical protein R3E97_06295 [Candidatus Eisenbacteria bacterium]